MANVTKPHPVKLFIAIIASSEKVFAVTEKILIRKFGSSDYRSNLIPFDVTDYYEREMGKGLLRVFLIFKKLIDPIRLSGIKLITNRIEKRIASNARGVPRPVNIDPGYINDAKIVLASCKDFSHRVYAGNGIYEEVTLSYYNKSFKSYDWTYPDYRSSEYLNILSHIRSIFMEQRKKGYK